MSMNGRRWARECGRTVAGTMNMLALWRTGKRQTHERAKDAMHERMEMRNRGKPWAQANRQYRAMLAWSEKP